MSNGRCRELGAVEHDLVRPLGLLVRDRDHRAGAGQPVSNEPIVHTVAGPRRYSRTPFHVVPGTLGHLRVSGANPSWTRAVATSTSR